MTWLEIGSWELVWLGEIQIMELLRDGHDCVEEISKVNYCVNLLIAVGGR